MTPGELISTSAIWAKATSAARVARLALDAGEPDDAASRACYAMLSAARALLLPIDRRAAMAKRHESIHAAFSEYFILAGKLPAEMAEYFRYAKELRRRADYSVPRVTPTEATALVRNMDSFLRQARAFHIASGGK